MALGAEHVQPAGFADKVGILGAELLVALDELTQLACGLWSISVKSTGGELGLGEQLGVAS